MGATPAQSLHRRVPDSPPWLLVRDAALQRLGIDNAFDEACMRANAFAPGPGRSPKILERYSMPW